VIGYDRIKKEPQARKRMRLLFEKKQDKKA